ncbi:MAG: DNA polymerase I [Candidatus Omnitrophota bacterium]
MSVNVLYLIDANAVLYRSFYAIKLSTSREFPTGAIYGFFTVLRKLIRNYEPQYIAICFDVSRKTHRQKKYKEYKSQRPPTPDNLRVQMPVVKQLVNYMGMASVEREGYEADDLISSLADKAFKRNWRAVIVSPDKDMYQLIRDDSICVFNPVKETMYNHDYFFQEFAFEPEYIVDYLGLIGDSSDNIPGAKGIGKVGASRLIKEFGTVENIFDNLDKIPDKIKSVLERSKDDILLSKELVKLEKSLTFDFDLDNLRAGNIDYQNVYNLCKELEFKSLLKEFSPGDTDIQIHLEDKLPSDFNKKIASRGTLFFYMADSMIFVFDDSAGVTYKVDYIKIEELFGNAAITKVSYDFKGQCLRAAGNVDIKGLCFDLQIAAYLVDPALGDYSFENILSHFLSIYIKEMPSSVYAQFACKMYDFLKQEIIQRELEKVFFEVELPLVSVLTNMERTGVAIDKRVLQELLAQADGKLDKTVNDIFNITKKRFNLNSPQQLSQVLFEELKLPHYKKTKKGFSTNEEVLQKLSSRFPVAALLLDYRHLSKLKSTYLLPFLERVKDDKRRLYTSFIQTGTQTGRLSSSSPNLQNIPVKGDFAHKLRGIFVSSFDHGFILSADYSQIELRILAHFSHEEALIKGFNQNIDIHKHTASLLFGVDIGDVDRKRREVAKRVNFGIIYGMSHYGLARELKISDQEARGFIDSYFLRYPGVKRFIDRVIEETRKNGFVRTILGRKRYLPDINSSNFELREYSCRQAVNTIIQGTAADLIKLAMVNIERALAEDGFRAKMIIQIHDELVFDTPPEELKRIIPLIKSNMENSLSLDVPVVVNLKAGPNWLNLEEVK